MIETIKFALNILPLIINITRELEKEFPESGMGKMKLSLILDSVKAITGDSKETITLVQKVIDTVVTIFNSFGIFKK